MLLLNASLEQLLWTDAFERNDSLKWIMSSQVSYSPQKERKLKMAVHEIENKHASILKQAIILLNTN